MEAATLALLIEGISEICRSDGLSCRNMCTLQLQWKLVLAVNISESEREELADCNVTSLA
jgi:hypothetical protein